MGVASQKRQGVSLRGFSMTESPGYVYAIQMEGHPVYKLGRCNSVPRRMSEIGIQLPFPYQLIFARKVKEPNKIETVLHRSLSWCRTNGEWFRLSNVQIEYLAALLLLLQAQELTDSLVEDLHNRHDGDSCIVGHYARVLVKASRRLRRRERALGDLRATHTVVDLVETIQ